MRDTLRYVGIGAIVLAVLCALAIHLTGCAPEPPRPLGFLGDNFTGGGFLGGVRRRCREISQNTGWTRNVMFATDGADGVATAQLDGAACHEVLTPSEEDFTVSIATCPPTTVARRSAWAVTTVMTGVTQAESAVFFDLDGDGAQDVVAAGEGNVVKISFGPTWADDYVINTAEDWITVAVGDVDADTNPDVVVGGKAGGVDSVIAWLKAPANPRTASGWTQNTIAPAAWIMSLDVRDFDGDADLDVVAADRQCLAGSVCTHVGTSVHENTGAGATWTHRTVRNSGVSQTKMATVVNMDGDGDLDVLSCASTTGPTNTIYWSRNDGSWTFVTQAITTPADVGQCQHLSVADVDRDGTADIVMTTDASVDVQASCSAVVWLRGPHPFSARWEISGRRGCGPGVGEKHDNAVVRAVSGRGASAPDQYLDVISTEQAVGATGYGLIWYENPGVCP